MGVICPISSQEARLQLSAMSAKTGAIITEGLTWHLFSHHNFEHQSTDASPFFAVPKGVYSLKVHHKKNTTTVNNIHLPAHSHQSFIITLGQKSPIEDSYFIADKRAYNSETEFERRQLDRKSQRPYTQHDDILKKPPTREQLQQQQQMLRHHQMGPQAHPVLSQVAQFDGAVEPEVNPVPSENPDTVNELVDQYQLTMTPDFNPKPSAPSSGPKTF